MNFKLNNDLNKLILDFHNLAHVWLTLLIALFLGFTISYGSFFLWEISDGFKPWGYMFVYDLDKSDLHNWIRKNFFYSNKFSFQDVLVWNLLGSLLGSTLRIVNTSNGFFF